MPAPGHLPAEAQRRLPQPIRTELVVRPEVGREGGRQRGDAGGHGTVRSTAGLVRACWPFTRRITRYEPDSRASASGIVTRRRLCGVTGGGGGGGGGVVNESYERTVWPFR